MRCIGLDVSSNTGWAHGDLTGKPAYGVFKLPELGAGDKDARALGGLYGSILSLVRENAIEVAAIEEPVPNIERTNKRGITTLSSNRSRDSLLMMFGTALAAVRNGGCRKIYIVRPASWRKQVLGNGYPQNPKQAMLDYCRIVFKVDLRDDNIADAMGIWQFALGQAKLL